MKSTPNLSSLVPWHRVVALVTGEEPSTQAVPYRSACPGCQGVLTTFQCTTGGGEWHHCKGCGFSGDNIEYAAFAWKLEVPATLSQLAIKLANRQLVANRRHIDGYVNDVIQVRRKNMLFWEQVRKAYPGTQGLRSLRESFRLPDPAESSRWSELLREHVGGCPRENIEQFLWPASASRVASSKMFRSNLWNAALVVPTWDLPGRIASFIFVAMPHHAEMRWSEKRVLPGLVPPASGVVFLPGLREKSGDLIVTHEFVLGFKAQSEQLSKKDAPLPLLILLPGNDPPELVRRTAQSRKTVVWGVTDECEVVRCASRLGSEVHAASRSLDKMQSPITDCGAESWLKVQTRGGTPWPQFLEGRLARMTTGEAEDWFSKMKLPAGAVNDFTKICSAKVRELVQFSLGSVPAKSVRFRNKTIVESEHGWHLDTGELVSEAILRFHTVAHKQRDDSVWYSGDIVVAGDVVGFTVPKRVVETRTSDWIAKMLVAAGKTVPSIDTAWERQLCQIALLFEKPVVADNPDQVGWESRQFGFMFPDFLISTSGEAEPRPRVADEDAPCLNFLPPREPSTLEIESLCPEPCTLSSLAWWFAVHHVLTAAVCRVFGKPMPNLAIFGPGASTARTLLECLGCVPRAADRADGWPGFVKKPRHTSWADYASREGQICFVEPGEAYGLHLLGWSRLQASTPLVLPSDVTAALTEVLPRVLQLFCKTGKHKQLVADDIPKMCRSLLVNWLLPYNMVLPRSHAHGNALTALPSDPASICRSLFGLAYAAIEDGQLQYERAGYRVKRSIPEWSIVSKEEELWIPRRGLESYVRLKNLPMPSFEKIEEALGQFPETYLGKRKMEGEEGWLVKETWFSESPSVRRRANNLLALP